MTNPAIQTPSSVTTSDVYQVLTSLVIHSEQIRWNRLNIFLIICSIFVAAWVVVLAEVHGFPCKQQLLIVLCAPGILLGLLMTRLGWRSSEYLDDFHNKALEMEVHFEDQMPKPFHLSQNRRESMQKDSEKYSSSESYTSSKWIVTAIPFTFAVLFLFLALISLCA